MFSGGRFSEMCAVASLALTMIAGEDEAEGAGTVDPILQTSETRFYLPESG